MLKIIGAGFGRTGTHTLAQALNLLGYNPCYTMYETGKPGHHDTWKAAVSGEKIDWQRHFQEYKAAVEWPTITFFPAVFEAFPDAKVILTMRDAESWYESAAETIFSGLEASAQNPDPEKRQSSALFRHIILERTFGNRYWDKEHSIDVYNAHIKAVIRLVPSEQLLKFSVKDGWEPLCNFLAHPVPASPFPLKHQRAEFLSSTPGWAKEVIAENAKKRASSS